MNQFNRRRFLSGSLTAAGALAAAPLISGGPRLAHAADVAKKLAKRPGQPEAMTFGLVTYLWGYDWDLPTLIRNCETAGVTGVELRSTHKHGVEPSMNKQQRAEVKKRFADSSVTCVGPGSDERYDNPNPAVVKKAIEATKGFIKLSADIGSTGVKVKPDRFYKDVPREKTTAQIAASLDELGKFGADYGQEIRLEVHGKYAPPVLIKEIIDKVTHPNVGLCWNSNGVDLQGKGLEHHFNLVRDRFGATLHIHELDTKKYPYQQLVDMLVKTDYRGWMLLEAVGKPKDRVAALKAQREIFEGMVAKAKAGK